MNAHTPVPWGETPMANGSWWLHGVDTVDCDGEHIGEIRNPSDAAHIVRCVNAFPKLVAALEGLLACRALKGQMVTKKPRGDVWSDEDYRAYDVLSQQLAKIEPASWINARDALAKATEAT